MLRRIFGRGTQGGLLGANVEAGWHVSSWRSWEPPSNLVVGESHHTGSFESLAGPARASGYLIPVAVDFIREPANPYDRNAIRADVAGHVVGHVNRAAASVLAPLMDGTGRASFSLAGLIRGGSTSAPNLGVQVWTDRRLTEGPSFIGVPLSFAPWPPIEEAAWEIPVGTPPRDPVERFEWLAELIEEMWEHRRYQDIVSTFMEAVDVLPAYLAVYPDTSDVPSLGYSVSIMAAGANAVELTNLRDRFRSDSRLARWVHQLDDAWRDHVLTEAVVVLAVQSPGVLQKDLHISLPGASKGRIQRACYWAAAIGRLAREKAGVSYALKVASSISASLSRDAVDAAIALFREEPDPADEGPTIENPTPLEDLLRPVNARLNIDAAPSPYQDPDGYDRWRRHYDMVHGSVVERNLRGIRAEKQGDLETAIALYEANVRDGFEGNHPYDRLAILYRKEKRYLDEIRVLERGVEVFSSVPPGRADVAPKLERFRARLEKARGIGRRET